MTARMQGSRCAPRCLRACRAAARAAVMHDLAAADSEPAVSARKNATTPSPAWRPTMPPASTMQRSARAYQTANEREIPRGRKTTRERRRRFQVGHQNRRRATIGDARRAASVRDAPGPPCRPPRQAATSPPRAWSACKTPQGFRERHRSEQTSTELTTSNPANRGRTRGPRPHGGKISGLKFVDQVRELGIDDPTKLFSTARRTRKHVGTNLQEARSTNLR